MEFEFEGIVKLRLKYEQGATKSQHVRTSFNLAMDETIDSSAYLKDGLPTKEGSKVLTHCFVQGLIGNIHLAHKEGYRDSAEHLRYIISELERGLIENVDLKVDKF